MSAALIEIASAIRSFKFNFATEDELQQGLTAALESAGYEPLREVRLGSRERIDILVGTIGIEVKTAGSAPDLLRQLKRYASHEAIDALVVVTSRIAHNALAGTEINGVPVEVVNLSRGLR